MTGGDPNGWRRAWAEESARTDSPLTGAAVIRFTLAFTLVFVPLSTTVHAVLSALA